MSSDREIRALTLSCLLLGFTGPQPPHWILDGLADGLGGLVLFGSNFDDASGAAALTEALRAAAGHDVVLALDEEGGDVTRLDRQQGSAHPGAAALGWLDDEIATEESYAATGTRLAQAGITVDLAPVADVNIDPRNPVIGVRSFGADPASVARQVAAAVRGLQRGGVAACAKHFPGHGATRSDSHHETATLDRTAEEIDAVELPPFSAAVDAGARAVMTGHLLVPSLDPARIATISPAITTTLLRDRLGFAGTVVTDALEMRALSAGIGMVDGAVRSLAAGADTIETGAQDYPDLLEKIPSAVCAAVNSGVLPIERLRDAARRTAELARPGQTGAPARSDILDTLAARLLEVDGKLPALERPLVVECRPPYGMASGVLPWSLAEPLAARVGGTQEWPASGPVDQRELAARAQGRSLVVVVRDPVRHEWQRGLVEAAAAHPSAVVVDVGWPGDVPPGLPVVRTRGVAPGLLVAAADLLAAS